MKKVLCLSVCLKSMLSDCFQMPNLDDHIVSTRCDDSIFAVVLDTGDKMFMSIVLLLLFARVEIPHSNRLVIRARVQILS